LRCWGKGLVGDDPIMNMRSRAEQCRRLASHIGDQKTVEILLKMANDIEADIQRLETERTERTN
jgi:hypothetical protein